MRITILLFTSILFCQSIYGHEGNGKSATNSKESMASKKDSNSIIQDLVILGKVWGFLKYYHTAVDKGTFNWDQELIIIIPAILQSQTVPERNLLLENWVDRLREFKKGSPVKIKEESIKLMPDLNWIN